MAPNSAKKKTTRRGSKCIFGWVDTVTAETSQDKHNEVVENIPKKRRVQSPQPIESDDGQDSSGNLLVMLLIQSLLTFYNTAILFKNKPVLVPVNVFPPRNEPFFKLKPIANLIGLRSTRLQFENPGIVFTGTTASTSGYYAASVEGIRNYLVSHPKTLLQSLLFPENRANGVEIQLAILGLVTQLVKSKRFVPQDATVVLPISSTPISAQQLDSAITPEVPMSEGAATGSLTEEKRESARKILLKAANSSLETSNRRIRNLTKLDKSDPNPLTRTAIVDALLFALSIGRLNPSLLAFDLIFSQLKAYCANNLSGMAARLCYSDQLYDFWYQFWRQCKIGGTKAYEHLRGNGVSADTNPGVSHLNVAGDRSGALQMPDIRTFQRLHEKKRADANAFGHSDKRYDNLSALFKQKQEYAAKNGRGLLIGGHTDDTDLGRKEVVCRLVNGKRVIEGAQDYGGAEKRFGRWVIKDIVQSKKELTEILNDSLHETKGLLKDLEDPKDILFFENEKFPRRIYLRLTTSLDLMSRLSLHLSQLLTNQQRKLDKKVSQQKEGVDNDAPKPIHGNAALSIDILESQQKKIILLQSTFESIGQRIRSVLSTLRGDDDDLFPATLDEMKESEIMCLDESVELSSILKETDEHLLAMCLAAAVRGTHLALYTCPDSLPLQISDIVQEHIVDSTDESTSREIWMAIMEQFDKCGIHLSWITQDGAGIGSLINRGWNRATTVTQLYNNAALSAAECAGDLSGAAKKAALLDQLDKALPRFISEVSRIHQEHSNHYLSCQTPVASVRKLSLLPNSSSEKQKWLSRAVNLAKRVVSQESAWAIEDALHMHDLTGENLHLVDIDGNVLWAQQVFGIILALAAPSLTIPEFNQWSAYVFFIHLLIESFENGIDFINNLSQPEANPFNPSKKLVFLYDWTHCYKRLVEAIWQGGFGDELCGKAWVTLAERGTNPIFTLGWADRDPQNVEMAKEFTTAAVELGLRELGFEKEADFARDLRRIDEAMHNNGLTDLERAARCATFLARIKKMAMPYFYSNMPSQHVPNLPFSDRFLKGTDKIDLGHSRLPFQQIVNLIASLEGLLILTDQVKAKPGNQENSAWPIIVHTALQQDDLESKFSVNRVLCGPAAMGRVNHTGATTGINAAESLMTDSDSRVTLALAGTSQGYLKKRNKKTTSYASMAEDPTHQYSDPLKWNTPVTEAPDTAKPTSKANSSAARQAARSDKSSPAALSVRSHHNRHHKIFLNSSAIQLSKQTAAGSTLNAPAIQPSNQTTKLPIPYQEDASETEDENEENRNQCPAANLVPQAEKEISEQAAIQLPPLFETMRAAALDVEKFQQIRKSALVEFLQQVGVKGISNVVKAKLELLVRSHFAALNVENQENIDMAAYLKDVTSVPIGFYCPPDADAKRPCTFPTKSVFLKAYFNTLDCSDTPTTIISEAVTSFNTSDECLSYSEDAKCKSTDGSVGVAACQMCAVASVTNSTIKLDYATLGQSIYKDPVPYVVKEGSGESVTVVSLSKCQKTTPQGAKSEVFLYNPTEKSQDQYFFSEDNCIGQPKFIASVKFGTLPSSPL
ncbi:hypothetical protein BDR26DRAFT_1010239 [Obelidium mucronatum]|nr:hypothetical protein BDR26DRAFT_1010239 [Obelidium mucronatum]